MFFIAPSQYIQDGAPFTVNGTSYPAGWLNATSAEEKAAVGLVEVTYAGAREDDRFYWVTETRVGSVVTYTNTPKDLAALKTQWKTTVNAAAYSMLLQSDWMVVKALETSTTVAAAWTTYRAAVRTAAATAVAAIESAADVPALQTSVQVTWPNDPNHAEMTDGA
jgi:hypothetical protein